MSYLSHSNYNWKEATLRKQKNHPFPHSPNVKNSENKSLVKTPLSNMVKW